MHAAAQIDMQKKNEHGMHDNEGPNSATMNYRYSSEASESRKEEGRARRSKSHMRNAYVLQFGGQLLPVALVLLLPNLSSSFQTCRDRLVSCCPLHPPWRNTRARQKSWTHLQQISSSSSSSSSVGSHSNNPNITPSSNNASSKNPLMALISIIQESYHRFHFLFTQRMRKLRKAIRYLYQRYTVYVLECEDDRYYVGSTAHKRQRFRQHMDPNGRGGSAWTRIHRPIRVCKQYRRVPSRYYLGLEAQITAELMLTYGVNSVRGAMFSEPRNYTLSDLNSLTSFLAHHNDLSYRRTESYLRGILPKPTGDERSYFESRGRSRTKRAAAARAKMKKKKKRNTTRSIMENRRMHDRCYHCGRKGHWAVDCPSLQRESNGIVAGNAADID